MDYDILDAREGHVDHRCRGMWDYLGLNAGGHEIFQCIDSDRSHRRISAHVSADHVCEPHCAEAATASEQQG